MFFVYLNIAIFVLRFEYRSVFGNAVIVGQTNGGMKASSCSFYGESGFTIIPNTHLVKQSKLTILEIIILN